MNLDCKSKNSQLVGNLWSYKLKHELFSTMKVIVEIPKKTFYKNDKERNKNIIS